MRTVGVVALLATLASAGLLIAPGVPAPRRPPRPRRSARSPRPVARGTPPGPPTKGSPIPTINIAYGDDRGFSGLPGLDQEMGDAVKAMIAWCNAQGGINGRKIVGDYYDAAVTNVGSVMTQACKQDFMLVGEGFALDGLAEQTRLGCNLAAVPGFTVAPAVANAYEMYQASPNPANASPVSSRLRGREALRLEDQACRRVRLHPLDPAVVHQQGDPGLHRGRLEVHPELRRADRLQRRGQLHAVRPEAPELRGADHLQRRHPGRDPLRRLRGGEPDRLRPDLGHGLRAPTRRPSPSGTPTGLANNAYVRLSYEPLEAAKVVPAVAQYLSIVKKYGGLTSQLGEQATSSFLLWATEAKACGRP